MSRNRYIENSNVDPEDLDYSKWPDVHIDPRNEIFENRKKAVQLYIDQKYSLKEIEDQTGIKRQELNEFVKKCLKRDYNNRLIGFPALIPFKRIGYKFKRYAATDGFNYSSLTGAFEQLLEKYPQLDELIKDYILRRKQRRAADNYIRIKDLRKKFLILCKSLDIKLNQYPFNTKDMCLRSLYRYVDKLINKNMEQASGRFGQEVQRIVNRLNGIESDKDLIIAPFETLQVDGHKMDIHLTIKFTNAYGDEIVEVLKRIWFLCLIDEGTRNVISYILCLSAELSSVDLLHLFKKAIHPWIPLTLTIPGLVYPEKPYMPSMAIEEAQWALWNELKCDNALANISNIVEDRLTKIVNCSINPGQAQYPEGRGIIERFFGLLEENYLHRLSMTTGSNPKDIRNHEGEKHAKKYEVNVEEIEQLMEVAVARYNTDPHSKFGISPLMAMEQRIVYRGMVPRQLNEHERSDVNFFTYQVHRTVKGSRTRGTRPYINFEGERYTSSLLAKNYSLIGEKLILEVNIDDICVVKAFLQDGQELDFLKVKGPWGKKPHSLKTRKVVNRLVRGNQLRFDDDVDPIEAFGKYLEEKAEKQKKYRNELATQRRYQKRKSKEEPVNLNTEIGDDPVSILPEDEWTETSINLDPETFLDNFKTIC
ncbi:hypothetical protein EJP82_06615 [Paenibacillus anaericanus]|uniref:Integrase catalytic domain-containing protein n=1 Tax=Paenibacillus anaericanus TaxID=170367 RepID=A0A3S1BQK6_9BACL|nr:hypothetical protein [Paenibacillus anaericanus]RUT47379.1 hypothetical protein EJP82_06615 [Paenibacillus anaericanus]